MKNETLTCIHAAGRRLLRPDLLRPDQPCGDLRCEACHPRDVPASDGMPIFPQRLTEEEIEAFELTTPAPDGETKVEMFARARRDIDRNYLRVVMHAMQLAVFAKHGLNAVHGSIAQAMHLIATGGAPNHVVHELRFPTRPGERWSATFQREGGKTPDDLIGGLRAQVAQLRAALEPFVPGHNPIVDADFIRARAEYEATAATPNPFLESYAPPSSVSRIAELEDAIRKHRDQRGDDRCWLDDAELYRAIGEVPPNAGELPERPAFLANCERYWQCRKSSETPSTGPRGKWITAEQVTALRDVAIKATSAAKEELSAEDVGIIRDVAT